MATPLPTEPVLEALNTATWQQADDAGHSSVGPGQYTSVAFGLRCKEADAGPSIGSVGDAYDKATCESSFATLECELLDRKRVKTQAEPRMAAFDFIEGLVLVRPRGAGAPPSPRSARSASNVAMASRPERSHCGRPRRGGSALSCDSGADKLSVHPVHEGGTAPDSITVLSRLGNRVWPVLTMCRPNGAVPSAREVGTRCTLSENQTVGRMQPRGHGRKNTTTSRGVRRTWSCSPSVCRIACT